MSEQKENIGELEELTQQSAKLAETYRRIFYKVDPAFVFDLVTRLQQDPTNPKPMYTVEVFTKEGTDPEKSRQHILNTTGSVPAIYDKGTHYVSHLRLNLEILKKLNDIDYVLEVMGDYTGSRASIGPQHDLGDWKKIKDKVTHK
ncbi:MAG: hypothetical protein E6K97_03140 [Thaumarchaeota archaeon]|nr:MAG: hypothetical protein E6K97_03140 [Nitrososphaerota archaeon]